ncbi:MAG: hypothetical protein H6945_08485 [Zoogloeaceae bacterium]|nr:hypothetical protein [Rhodocyclaceae bacterium]MCP5235759.1 hypothetical protein [Zoogloeaceae bacterium]
MDFLASLDVFFGLTFIYLVFALAVTAINEFIAAAWSSRARWLRRAIANLLTPPDERSTPRAGAADGEPLFDWLLPLKQAWQQLRTVLSRRGRQRASAEIATGEDGKAAPKRISVDDVLASPFIAYLDAPGVGNTFRVSYLSAWQLLQGALDAANEGRQAGFVSVANIRMMLAGLPARSPYRKVLEDLCARAGNDMTVFRTLLEEWFKGLEKQMSSWYRQKTQYVIVGISAFVAFAMNVDTIDIATRLYQDASLREAVVTQALEAAKAEDAAAFIDSAAMERARAGFEAAERARHEVVADSEQCEDRGSGAPTLADGSACDPKELKAAIEAMDQEVQAAAAVLSRERRLFDERVSAHIDELASSGLEFGWSGTTTPDGTAAWITKIFGLLLSAAALSLGAPFWFEMLKNLAAVRSVGRSPRERKPEGKPGEQG